MILDAILCDVRPFHKINNILISTRPTTATSSDKAQPKLPPEPPTRSNQTSHQGQVANDDDDDDDVCVHKLRAIAGFGH